MDSAIPPDVAAFRTRYRAANVGPSYRGGLHFAFTSLGALAAIGFAASRVHQASAAALLTVPGTFFFANLVEYLGHKGPMHHKKRGLGLLFERHARQHHRFFTDQAMGFESSRDFKMVLFPPVMLLFFLGAIALPVGLLLYVTFGANVGGLFTATAVSYFLTYEWLHLSYHFPEGHPVYAIPGLKVLRQHHLRHHDPRSMGRCNFNITFPIADRFFGTNARPLASPPLAPETPPDRKLS